MPKFVFDRVENIVEQDVFVKNECPCNDHVFENCDVDIWPWPRQMTLTLE